MTAFLGLVTGARPAFAETVHPDGCGTVSLMNVYTSLYVSVELGTSTTWYEELRARATSVGPWEKFTMCINDSTNVFTLQSQANGLYVTTEEWYDPPWQYMLQADSSTVGQQQQFVLYNVNADYQWFTGSSGYLVSGDLNFSGNDRGVLIANRKSLGPWEEWVVHPA